MYVHVKFFMAERSEGGNAAVEPEAALWPIGSNVSLGNLFSFSLSDVNGLLPKTIIPKMFDSFYIHTKPIP